MESVFHVAEQAVNVFARDAQASPLGIVQFPRESRSYDLRSSFGHDFSSPSMHDHDRTMRILENSLRVRAQHPAMKDGVAALAKSSDLGLDGVRPVKNLFRRVAHHNIGLKFNLLLPGALAERHETELIAFARIFKNGVELRALGRFRRTDYSHNIQLGFHIPGHRKGNIQSVLGMRRRVECNQYSLKSNKNRASHGFDLYLFCGGAPLNCMLRFLACWRVGKKMPGQKERVSNHGRNHRTGDDRAHQVGILGLGYYIMTQAKERRDGAKGEAGRHHQRVVGSGVAFVTVRPDCRKHNRSLGQHLRHEQDEHGGGSCNQRGHRDKRSGANEVERREQSEGQSAQAADERVVFAHCSPQNHADQVGWEHRFAARPNGQSAQGKEKKKNVLGFKFGDATAVLPEEPRREKRQGYEDRDGNHDKDQRLDGKRGEDQSQRNHRSEIIDEASGKDRLTVLSNIETKFQHHRINHGHRGRGKSDAAEPTGHDGPVKYEMRDGRATEKWAEESRQSDDQRFAALGSEDGGIEFRAGKKGQDDGPGSRQKSDPLRVAEQSALHKEHADNQLSHRTYHDFRKRRRYPEPDRQQRSRKRQPHP